MDAGLGLIAIAAGFVAFKVVGDKGDAVAQPGKAARQPFWNEYMDSGDQPSTGNGSPGTDQTGKDVAGVINTVGKFATSLLDWMGSDNADDRSGSASYGGGRLDDGDK